MLRKVKHIQAAAAAIALAFVGVPAVASAHEGDFAKFNYCPSTTPGVAKCLDSVTTGGKVVLGKKTTPIVNPVTLQGGYSEENEVGESTFYAATNGETLSKTPQPVPGGLAGIVPPESAPPIVKEALELVFDNGLTGVNATLELAKPASEIRINEYELLAAEGIALKLPVKVHLENPFLGGSCYVGSSSHPLIWNLTAGTTSPPAGYEAITGKPGYPSFKDEYRIAEISENELVENDWEAPKATGCGGILSLLVDPIIDETVGLPAEAGVNVARLENQIAESPAAAVNKH
ncbi:MAG TPA: hypothetical protein VMU32_03035 [Solirubrobacteraceae bacterium]|nr:hypothetical protein [Solirubrobacteraceae bacterium]